MKVSGVGRAAATFTPIMPTISNFRRGDIRVMHDLTGFQQDLLFTVAGLDAPNGVEIKSEMERYYGSEIRHGRLYPNLDTLVEHGLVHKGQKDRRTNEYTLTDEGRTAIADRISWQTDLASAGGINVGRRTIPNE